MPAPGVMNGEIGWRSGVRLAPGMGHLGLVEYLPLSTFASGRANSSVIAGYHVRRAGFVFRDLGPADLKAWMVSRLATASAKCIGMKTTPIIVRWVTPGGTVRLTTGEIGPIVSDLPDSTNSSAAHG